MILEIPEDLLVTVQKITYKIDQRKIIFEQFYCNIRMWQFQAPNQSMVGILVVSG